MEPGMNRVEVLSSGRLGPPRAVRRGAGWVAVDALAERWVVEVGWWRTPPARRRRLYCWRVLLEDGGCLDLRWEPGAGWLAREWG